MKFRLTSQTTTLQLWLSSCSSIPTSRSGEVQVERDPLIKFSPTFRQIFLGLYKQRNRFFNNGYFTVVLLDESLSTLQQLELSTRIFNAFWSDSVTNILLLTSDQQRTTFYTYYVYSAEACGRPQAIAYNYFWHDADSGDNNMTGFEFDRPLFPKKCNNLFNCTVNVATFEFPPFMILRGTGQGMAYFDGVEGIVLRVLSQRLNFTPILVSPEDNERWGACDEGQEHCNGSVKLVRIPSNFVVIVLISKSYRFILIRSC